MLKYIIFIVLMLSVSICSAADNSQFTKSVNEFNWKYLSVINKDENIFYSPYGIVTALSVVANGAEADTQSEILDVISVNSIKDLNQSYKNLQNKIAVNYKINGRIFSDSNLILIDNKLADKGINRSYKNVVENIYKSDIRTADFKNNLSNEKRKITTWVDDKTKHFIPNYQSIVTEDTIMDILNVVYFKGDWQMPFEAENTYKSTFTNQDKSTNSIKMMNKSFKKSIKYYEDKKYKSIEEGIKCWWQ